ncbi:MAG TPA: sigma-70 family RNA polymerase sigma factor, partial [Xanthobacteraceae bacterium]|nr:sigma-70 family RNA polymerase sigma factor [Xanthobacteraceae bacterium]
DAYLKIWRSAGEFDPRRATPITWMVAIARNRALDLVRKKSETSIEDEPTALEAPSEVANPLERQETTEQLRRLLVCLDVLESERRELVLLAYFAGFSREQLAAKFGAPVNTVKTWLRRSLVQIRECLGS